MRPTIVWLALATAAVAIPSCGGTILGSAASFAVLGASTVTNTGSTTLGGNLGLFPGSSITGAGSITVSGVTYICDGVSQTAQSDALTGFNSLAAMAATMTLTGDVLGSGGTVLTLTPGIYFYASSAQLTGALTLDFEGLSNQIIVVQIGTALTTASGSSVLLINPGANDSVYWVVGSSATLGTTTSFAGNIVANQSVTLNNSATDSCGSIIALTGAVTMDTNTVTAGCSSSSTVSAPEPGTWGLVGLGCLLGTLALRKLRFGISS
jgi:Ice-binding-like/PEP-CTERM motif